MSAREDELKSLIQNGQIDQAIEMVRSAKNHREGEDFVFAVLGEGRSTSELVEAVLEAFLGTRENYHPEHGYWVHNLSHFTKILWENRMYKWVKKFNEIAFRGVNELRDSNCSDKLIRDFGEYALYNHDPREFFITPELLGSLNADPTRAYSEYNSYHEARIKEGPFESEEAFLRWKLYRPEIQTTYDSDMKINQVNVFMIRNIVKRLRKLGVDVTEFISLERNLLRKQRCDLDERLSEETVDVRRMRLEHEIRQTIDILKQIPLTSK